MMMNQFSEQEHEEFMLLMSLALDGLLDVEEQAQFEQYQQQYPALTNQWQEWQQMHQQMNALPHAIPAANFVDRFELRLIQQERRRRLWQGMWIGIFSLLLWTVVTVGMLYLGTYVVANQSTVIGDVLGNVIYYLTAVVTWVNNILITFNNFATTPQALGLGIGYLLLTMGMLAGWFVYLRRSTQLIDVSVSI